MLWTMSSSLCRGEERFTWGTATAAYQVEGSRTRDGRSPSIWDAFDTANVSDVISSLNPKGSCRVNECQNAERADDDYVRFEESANLTSRYGFGAARMSISMPRVMTYTYDRDRDELSWTPNEKGIAHYKSVFREYAERGIEIALTMWHWDLPLAIEEAAALSSSQRCFGDSAWLCHDLVTRAFGEYASLLMKHFADDVTYWITLNEPLTIIGNAYCGIGVHAPGRCSDRTRCYEGDDAVEPYVAAKGLLLAHAAAFRAWQDAGSPGRSCGVTLNGDFRVPFTDADVDAANRDMEYQVAIFADPIYFGRWPPSIDDKVRTRLADKGWAWTEDEVKLVNQTHDGRFFMNTYTAAYAREGTDAGCGYFCDRAVESSPYDFETGEPIGTPSSNGWLYAYGPALGQLMSWYNERYPGLRFVVTENGWGNATSTRVEDDLMDLERCEYYRSYIGNMSMFAARNNIDVEAYFAWSLMDNYEWADGFTTRFGLTYVDYESQTRTPKLSSRWFQEHVTSLTSLPTDGRPLPPCDSDRLRRMVLETPTA